MDKEECIRNGYMVLKQGANYYVRLTGFPLMVLLKFNDIKAAHAWIDGKGEAQSIGKVREIRDIRKFQKRYGVW